MKLKINNIIVLLVFILCVGGKQETKGQVVEKDSLALIALYDSTDGTNWTNKTNWLTNEPVSNWYGITVENDRVIKLDLSLNNLVGTIPPNFKDLNALTELNLERNEISGPFPEEVLALSNLIVLLLRNNKFSGPIPNNIDTLTKLVHLELSNNPLSGHLPSELGNLSNLTDLRIGGTLKIDGPIPPELGNLSKLTYLEVRQNKLDGSIPPELGNLTNLTSLELYYNKLTGEIPPELGNLINLTRLFLNHNQLTGEVPNELGNLTQVDNLQLNNNKLTGTIPNELGNLDNLEILFLGSNKLSGSVPNEITGLSKLEKFRINDNKLASLPNLSTLTSLTELFIQNNNFTFGDIEPNIGIATTFTYTPQDSIGSKIDTTIDSGTSITFTISAGGENSIYKWIKDGIDLPGAQDSIYTISSAIMDDSGIYICEVTNTIATELTLYSKQINLTVGNPVGLREDDTELPTHYQLMNNYPNPFNPSTSISYAIPQTQKVILRVYDILGKQLTTLVNEEKPTGTYKVTWNASNLPSGIYFYRIQAENFVETKKIVLLK
jgi:Leucine-rich repeat (LRR) protein